MILGDRTKHLKNLHGIHKLGDTPAGVNGEAVSPVPTAQNGATDGLIVGLPGRPSETKPAIGLVLSGRVGKESDKADVVLSPAAPGSFFTTTTKSARRGDHLLVQSSKFDPLDINMSCLPSQETVSMSLDEVLQYAQPVADFF